jgi:hypothetical protein
MKTKIALALVVPAILLIANCASTTKMFDFTYASSETDKIDPAAGQKVADVVSDWVCKGKDKRGMLETATSNALKKAGNGATYLKDVKVMEKGSCIQVSGEAYK